MAKHLKDRRKARQQQRQQPRQGAGRPRQEGERYPCGKLKPPPETPRQRPFAVISEEAVAYADLHRRAGYALLTAKVADMNRVGGMDASPGCVKAIETLRRIWARLAGDDLALVCLAAYCLLDEVPWFGTPRSAALGRGLSAVAAELAAEARPARSPRPFSELQPVNDDEPAPTPWSRRDDVETTAYVNAEGETLFEAVRRRRRERAAA